MNKIGVKSEHGGTLVDTPIHFAEKGSTIEQIPMEQCSMLSQCQLKRELAHQLEFSPFSLDL